MSLDAPVETDPRLRIIDLRNRALAGEKLTPEEVSEALKLLAANRTAATTRATAKKKPKGEPLPTNLGDLFS